MRATALFVLALATYAAAVPENAVVPEEALVQFDSFNEDQFAATKLELDQMRTEGKDDKDCRELADDTEDDVKKNVAVEQKTLDEMDKGEKCPEEGSDAEAKAKDALKEADDAAKKATDEYNDALKTELDFGKFQFNALTKGNCDTFFKSSVYTDAETKVNNAKTKKNEADGAAKQAKKDHDNAVEAQKKAENKCYCDLKALHKKTLDDMNTKVAAANQKAWTKAAHIRCVLDGTPIDKCKVTALPTVNAVKLTAEAEAAECAGPGVVMKSDYNNHLVKSVVYEGAAKSLTWDMQYQLCNGAGLKTPGSSNPSYMNKYCSYSSSANYVVTQGCNWSSQKFTYVSGSIDKPAYMCAHSNCNLLVKITIAGTSVAKHGITTIQPGDSVMCADDSP